MFDIRKFIIDTLYGMHGNYPDFQIREYALNWYGKGKLTEEDLAEIKKDALRNFCSASFFSSLGTDKPSPIFIFS